MEAIFKFDNIKKNEFLKNVKESYELATYNSYYHLIHKVDEFENYKGFSVLNMSKADFLELFTLFNTSNLSVLYSYRSAIIKYLLYQTNSEYFRIGILELDSIKKEDLIDCLNTRVEDKQFITKKEYYELLDNPNGNYQDKLVVVLLWNKIRGSNDFSEIRNLKTKDVNVVKNLISIEDRVIELTEKEMNIIINAMIEQHYKIINIKKDHTVVVNEIEYLEGDYLVKATSGTRNANSTDNMCPYSSLANRLSKYFRFALGRAELSGVKIYKSSSYYYMLLEYGRKLTQGEFVEYKTKNNLKLTLSNYKREQDIIFNKMMDEGLFNCIEVEFPIINDYLEDKTVIEELSNTIISDEIPTPYLEVPREKKAFVISENNKVTYPRSKKVYINALKLSNYKCEIDYNHNTFMRKKDGKPYTEPHHIIPLSKQDEFNYDLDIEENIISLCSNCHNQIHYGQDFEQLLNIVFEKRKNLLNKCGISFNYDKLIEYYK